MFFQIELMHLDVARHDLQIMTKLSRVTGVLVKLRIIEICTLHQY